MLNIKSIIKKVSLTAATAAAVLTLSSCPEPITAPMVALVEDTIPPTINISTPRGGDNYYSSVTVTGIISDDVLAEGDESGQITTIYYEIANDDFRKGKINIGLDDTVTADEDFGNGTVSYDLTTREFSFTFSTISPTKLRDSLSLYVTAVDRNNNEYTEEIDLLENDGPWVEYYYYTANDYLVQTDTLPGEGVGIKGTIADSEYSTDTADELVSIAYGRVGLSYGASLDITEGSADWNSTSGLFSAYDTYNDQLLNYDPESREFWTYTTEVVEEGTTFYVKVTDKSGHTTEVQKLLPPPGSLNLTTITSTIPYYSSSAIPAVSIPITTRVVDPNDNMVEDDEVSKITYSFRSDYGESVPSEPVEVFNISDPVHANPIDFWDPVGDNSDNGRFNFNLDTSVLAGFNYPVKLRVVVYDIDNDDNGKTLELERDVAGPTISVTGFTTTGGNLTGGITYLNKTDTAILTFTVEDGLSGIADGINSIESILINGQSVDTADISAVGDGSFTAEYELSDAAIPAVANLTYSISAKDNLNNNRTTSPFTDSNKLYYPDITDITESNFTWASSNSPSYSGWARATDTVTGTVTSSRVLSTSTTIQIGSLTAVPISSGTPYTATSAALSGAGFITTRDDVKYTAYIVDAAGNTFSMTDIDTGIDYDGSVPTAPSVPTWSYGDFINISEYSGSLTLTTEYSGSGALSGDTIELYLNSITATPLAEADYESDFSTPVTISGSELGSHGSKTIFARIVDAAGNVGAVSSDLEFFLDLVRPGNPVSISSNAGDDYINKAEYDSTTNIAVTVGYGSSNSDDDIRLSYNGHTQTVGYDPGLSSTFSIADLELVTGDNDFYAYTVDEAGNECATPQELTLILDTTPPATPSDIAAPSGGDYINAADLSGDDVYITVTYNNAGVNKVTLGLGSYTYTEMDDTDGETVFTVPKTDLDTPSSTFTAKTTDIAGNDSSEATITLDVDVDPPGDPTSITTASNEGYINLSDISAGNALVTVNYPPTDVSTVKLVLDTHTYTVTDDTDGSTTFEVPEGHLTASSTFEAYTEDSAQNKSTSIYETFTVDTVLPGAPSDLSAPSGGTYINSGDIDGGNVIITVTYSTTDVTEVSLTLGGDTYTSTSITGSTAFTIPEADLSGSNNFTAATEDEAGNMSSFPKTLTLDTTPPATPTDIAAPSGGDYINSDDIVGGNVIITVTYPTTGGISKVSLTLGTATSTNITDLDGSTDFTISSGDLSGSNAFSATTEDAAGNESAALDVTLTRDTTPPVDPVSIDSSESDAYINSAEYAANNLIITVEYSSSNSADQIRLDYNSQSQTDNYQSGNSSTFSIPNTHLVSGENTFTAYTVDAAGNECAIPQSLALTLDTVPPVAPESIEANDADLYINLTEYGDSTDTEITVNYDNVNSSDSIRLYHNGTPQTVVYDASKKSTFTFADDTDLVIGDNIFNAYTVDTAGNESTAVSLTVHVDITAPSFSDAAYGEHVDEFEIAPAITEEGSGIETYIWAVASSPVGSSYSFTAPVDGSLVVGADGAYADLLLSDTIGGSDDGDYTVSLTVDDVAGNSATHNFTFKWTGDGSGRSLTLTKPVNSTGTSSGSDNSSGSSGSRINTYDFSNNTAESVDSGQYNLRNVSSTSVARRTGSYSGGLFGRTAAATVNASAEKPVAETDKTKSSTVAEKQPAADEAVQESIPDVSAQLAPVASSAVKALASATGNSAVSAASEIQPEREKNRSAMLLLIIPGAAAGIVIFRKRRL